MLRIVLGYKTNQVSESPVVLYCGRDGNAALAAARKGHADGFIRITQANGPHEYRVNVAQMIADEAASAERAAQDAKERAAARAKQAEADAKRRETEAKAAAESAARARAIADAAKLKAEKVETAPVKPRGRRSQSEPETTT